MRNVRGYLRPKCSEIIPQDAIMDRDPNGILQAGEVQSFSYILLCRCIFEVTIIVIFADGIGQYWDKSGQKYSFYMSYFHLLIDIFLSSSFGPIIACIELY